MRTVNHLSAPMVTPPGPFTSPWLQVSNTDLNICGKGSEQRIPAMETRTRGAKLPLALFTVVFLANLAGDKSEV